MGAVHTITLQGGPYHGQTRPVPEPPRHKESWLGINSYAPQLYYAFERHGTHWMATAIYIQDPYNPVLFHFHANAKDPS